MKLTTEQQGLLDAATEAYANLVSARAQAKVVARRAEQDYIADYQLEWDKAAARYALSRNEAGQPAPKRQLRLLTSQNPRTVDDAIESGRRFVKEKAAEERAEATPEPEATGPQRFAWDGKSLTVTLTPADFEPFASALPRGVPEDQQSWSFTLENGVLIPDFATDDATWQNPVVTVVMNTKVKQDAIAFAQSTN